jgi:hypothetical protein
MQNRDMQVVDMHFAFDRKVALFVVAPVVASSAAREPHGEAKATVVPADFFDIAAMPELLCRGWLSLKANSEPRQIAAHHSPG